jgi:hypothetical protein
MDAEKFNFVQAKHFYLDVPKQPPSTCFVLYDDFTRVTERLEDEWKSNNALMKLLADEKHKSEALAAELAGVRSDLAMCEAKGSSLQMRTDKADLLRVLGVADERIRALEAEVAEARRCLDGGTDCMDDKRKLRDRICALEAGIQAVLDGHSDSWPDQLHALLGSELETACECHPLAARGTPGDLEVYCPKCGNVYRKSETAVEWNGTYCPDGLGKCDRGCKVDCKKAIARDAAMETKGEHVHEWAKTALGYVCNQCFVHSSQMPRALEPCPNCGRIVHADDCPANRNAHGQSETKAVRQAWHCGECNHLNEAKDEFCFECGEENRTAETNCGKEPK